MKSNPIITDEMLAAYLAGNATTHETALILHAIESDPTIRETLRITAEIESEQEGDLLPMMAMAAKNEVDNLCAIRCAGYALRKCGINVSDEQLHQEAVQTKSLSKQGMPFGMIGELIRPHGLNAQYISKCSIDSLRQYLSEDVIVIALVDGGELTGDLSVEKQEDLSCGPIPDHVVVVDSLLENQISICDSCTPQQLDTYPLAVFKEAWEDSGCSIVIVKN